MISLILLDDSFNELRLFRSSCILLLVRLSMMLHVAWSLEIYIYISIYIFLMVCHTFLSCGGLRKNSILCGFEIEFHIGCLRYILVVRDIISHWWLEICIWFWWSMYPIDDDFGDQCIFSLSCWLEFPSWWLEI